MFEHEQFILVVLYLTQNLFPPGKLSRTISLNSHYIVVFKNPRDSLGISTLAKQMFPGRTKYLMVHLMMQRRNHIAIY